MEALIDIRNLLHIKESRLSVTLGLFLIFLGLLYWYSIYPFAVLSRCGIKHPKPTPFFGNIFMFRQGFFYPLTDLIKKYGRVCGYYIGRRPVVLVADPDMLRQMMVKDFNMFPNRVVLRTFTKPMCDCLIMLRNERWRRVRSILTPSFSAAKMKEMVPLINTAVNVLMNNLGVYADSQEAFNIHKCFGCFTMDVIASVAFGTQLDSQNNPDDPFVCYSQMFFSFSFFRPIILFLLAFPFIATILERLIPNKKREEMNQFFINSIQEIIRQREEQPPEERRRDFLQLMLDARTSGECEPMEYFDAVNLADEFDHKNQQTQPLASEEENRLHPQQQHTRRPQKKITDDEIVGQAFVFLLAGYETSSSTLAFTCYLLAIHPECQSKVQEEVDDFFTRHESPDYSNVHDLKYLDMVISESLRLYPPGFRFGRHIDHDCVVNGQFLPKGVSLEIPVSFLHYDPEHWPEPERFIPERSPTTRGSSSRPSPGPADRSTDVPSCCASSPSTPATSPQPTPRTAKLYGPTSTTVLPISPRPPVPTTTHFLVLWHLCSSQKQVDSGPGDS
ncbi:thromboxane-A synthase isoform X2 [Antennarius striatus]|uniref:thromboxane-A synthase isoform X2 n=1 Tax=Antennarius striatus TaxID=241820 RepID=UPI0035B45C6F